MQSLALRYYQHGAPSDVLRLESVPVPAPGPRQVLVKMKLSPIHPSDFGQILGNYGELRNLPAGAGREAVGEVVAVGDQVEECKPGQLVRFPEENGTWQTYALASADEVWVLPDGLPLELAAMAWINPPTAWRVLRDAHLGVGDWLIQNAANSSVGLFVIQMARHLGLHTINLVRRPELIAPLQQMGADLVLLDDDEVIRRLPELTGGSRPLLALNSVGGESAIRLLKALSDGGKHLTIGAMTFESIRFPTRYLIFHDISIRGFWLDRWLRMHSRQRAQIMFDKLFTLMRTGVLAAPIEQVYSLEDYRLALAHASRSRLGKIMFRGS